MAKYLQTRSPEHAERLAKALLKYADGRPNLIRTETWGSQGIVFLVSEDEIADKAVAEVDGEPQDLASTGTDSATEVPTPDTTEVTTRRKRGA